MPYVCRIEKNIKMLSICTNEPLEKRAYYFYIKYFQTLCTRCMNSKSKHSETK